MKQLMRYGGLNWDWYLVLEKHGERSCTVIEHNRVRDSDVIYPKVKRVDPQERRETEDRTLTHIGKMKVRNPEHVFSYKDPERMKLGHCPHGFKAHEDGSCNSTYCTETY